MRSSQSTRCELSLWLGRVVASYRATPAPLLGAGPHAQSAFSPALSCAVTRAQPQRPKGRAEEPKALSPTLVSQNTRRAKRAEVCEANRSRDPTHSRGSICPFTYPSTKLLSEPPWMIVITWMTLSYDTESAGTCSIRTKSEGLWCFPPGLQALRKALKFHVHSGSFPRISPLITPDMAGLTSRRSSLRLRQAGYKRRQANFAARQVAYFIVALRFGHI